ncbi:hypothetical protein SY83_21010 [Paenibacillus swuensis]|uniref:HTH araC/xylS-type domain-containing protein n=1 Tax=Paenibacillus swuensis TaxID=1178515 RepID=A0A172TMU3_9BACL|nr:AraC family transcriptional regulator [Paenibacillus swuensis]ANE48348.1 hypothetical protein SY83_21010 [Paenibacillus swuensis]
MLPQVHSVGDMIVKPGFTLGPRVLGDYELVYFPSANGTTYTFKDQIYTLDKPSLLFTKPGEEHTYYFDRGGPVRHLYVHFEMNELMASDSSYETWLDHPVLLPLRKGSLVPVLFSQMLQIAHQQPRSWQRRIGVVLLAILEEWGDSADLLQYEQHPDIPSPIQKAISHMESRLHLPITIESIAEITGWTHEHFTRKFHKIYGITPKKALLERRIRRAEQLLITEDWTVKRVAYESGFGDEHHFSKMFKQLRGMPATVFRERYADPYLRNTATVEGLHLPYPINTSVFVSD